MNQFVWENMDNNRFLDVSSAAINNGKNAKEILLQQSYDDQQCRFNYQCEVDQDGDISMRDQLLKVTDDSLQQDQRSRMLGDIIPARMQKLMISHEENATTDVQIKCPVGDISDGHHQSRNWLFGLNRNIEEASVSDATKTKRNRGPTIKGKEYQLPTLDGRKQLAARLQRKSTIINEMLLCKGNIVAVREELSQLDDLFKIIEDNEKMIALDEAKYSDEQWFDELDEKTFAIKHKVYSLLKEAERELDDVESRRSSSKNQEM